MVVDILNLGRVDFPSLESPKSSVLIVGGGPSTLETERYRDLEVDLKISTSTCYLNPFLHTFNLDYHIVSVQTDFNSSEFKTFHSINPDLKFIIEPNHLWKYPPGLSTLESSKRADKINISVDYRIGIAARAIIAFIILGFRDIYFVGFDGYSPAGEAQHAFLKDKSKMDSAATVNTYDKMLENFKRFFKLTEELGEHYTFKLHNLGQGHPSNIPTTLGYK